MSSLGYVRESDIFSGILRIHRRNLLARDGCGNNGRDDTEDGPSKKSTGSYRNWKYNFDYKTMYIDVYI